MEKDFSAGSKKDGGPTDWYRQLGMRRRWSRSELREMVALVRDWRSEYQEAGGFETVKQAFPGYEQDLRRILSDGGSLEEFMAAWGLSREEARAVAVSSGYELSKRQYDSSLFRVFDDESNCFVPVSFEEKHALVMRLREKARRRNSRLQYREQRRASAQYVKDALLGEGVPPPLKDVASFMGVDNTVLARFWGWRPENNTSFSKAYDRLYRAGGSRERPRKGGDGKRGEFPARVFVDKPPGTLGYLLNQRRMALGLTTKEAGDAVGCAPNTVFRHISNHSRPSAKTLELYSSLFDIPLEKLLLVQERTKGLYSRSSVD